jgi:hypothetical protein
MRRMRVEIAVLALMLAPLVGYAVAYLAAGRPAPETRVGVTAVSEPPAAPGKDGRLGT